MSDIELYMFPGACSRVTMSALEEIGLEYREHMVDLRSAEQKSEKYLAVNPKGKVPMLRIAGRSLTENAAILSFLDRQHPAARLLPRSDDAVTDLQGLMDLVWCTGTLHPIVRQIRAPQRMTSGDVAGVAADGREKWTRECGLIDERLGAGPWWYGSDWSIVDNYLDWLSSTSQKGGFELSHYPHIVAHAARVRARPSFQAVLAREAAVAAHHQMPADVAR